MAPSGGDTHQSANSLIHVIDGIAFQTNIPALNALNALNAAGKAARAGAMGMSLAVVASASSRALRWPTSRARSFVAIPDSLGAVTRPVAKSAAFRALLDVLDETTSEMIQPGQFCVEIVLT